MSFWDRIAASGRAAMLAWNNSAPVPKDWWDMQRLYGERWGWYSGTLFESMARYGKFPGDPAIYRNTKLVWKHVEAIVNFYAGVIYQGALSTNGKPLPNHVQNAIPISPETPTEERNADLMIALSELWAAWNWQQQMSYRPMYAAALGDCLTELVDNPDRRFVYPSIVWPGYVKWIEIDDVDNVRGYTLEYRVQEKNRDGTNGDSYTYRKEVDGDAFRHYRDGRPWTRDGIAAVEPNPYGFVPAIWDRHRVSDMNSMRGLSATDGTRSAMLELNGLLSHGIDFQHQALWVPPMLASRSSGMSRVAAPVDIDGGGRELVEQFRYRHVPEDARLMQAEFDLGQTLAQIEFIRNGILDENPEAAYYQKLRDMAQVSGIAVDRLTGDVMQRVTLARAGYDTQSIKLFQMAIAMIGFRIRDTGPFGYTRPGAPPLNRRRSAFLPFDLSSYDRGELDFTIMSRGLTEETESERLAVELQRVQVIAAKEQLTTTWGLTEAIPNATPEEIERIIAERGERDALYPYSDVEPPPAEATA